MSSLDDDRYGCAANDKRHTIPATTAIFVFDHAISFNAPLIRVAVEPLAVAPIRDRYGRYRFSQRHWLALAGIEAVTAPTTPIAVVGNHCLV